MKPFAIARTRHRFVEIDGVRIFYRESVPESGVDDRPPLLLLHGFPSASHQYRRLIDALGSRYRIIAPDYPGFGHSDAPKATSEGGAFTYSFDRLSEIVEGFVDALGLTRVVLYVFDFGAPVGLRIASRRPDWVAGLIVQNGNAYEEGLSDMARAFVMMPRDEAGAVDKVRSLLTLPSTRAQYETGTTDPELIAPDGWTLDQHFLDLPERAAPQIDLAFDYQSNLQRYPEWQAWLRERKPPTLIVWGRNDPFFPEPGAHAYLRDVPDAELHVFDTGHFALEECLPQIAPLIADFVERIGA